MPQPSRAATVCGRSVSGLFHSPWGVLFAFPSRYWFTIGHSMVFSLGGRALRIRAGFHVSRPTWDSTKPALDFGYGALTLCGSFFQKIRLSAAVPCRGPATPWSKLHGLGSSAFARHYLRNRCYFLFLRVLRCFTSPGVTSTAYFIQPWMAGHDPRRIAPFGHPGINVCLPLPRDFRSLPRPSSSCYAKASAKRPFALDYAPKICVLGNNLGFSKMSCFVSICMYSI